MLWLAPIAAQNSTPNSADRQRCACLISLTYRSIRTGGFSKVRLGTHLLTGEKVAIKCMEKEKLGEDLFRVQTEINALKVLQHENISKLLQVIETETKIYLILEVNI